MRSNTKGIELGDIVKDSISGFKGVVVAITDWVNGCRRLTLQPQEMKDGKPIENHTFDIEQVDLVKKAKTQTAIATHGGPSISPAQRQNIKR